jgi:hypothetical protein
MKRYILRAFGGILIIGAPSPPVTIPPTNVTLYVRKGNITLRVREGDNENSSPN